MPVPDSEQITVDARLGDLADAAEIGRDARFRVEVVSAYDYTCALTGHRLLTIDAGSLVDAAHIHPFSDSRNNDPRNGIALCKNAHWAFDEGLWTIDDDRRIVVAADAFAEACPDGRAISTYDRAPLRLPSNRNSWPEPLHVEWHRKNRFVGAI